MPATIYFYIPKSFWPAQLPATSAENWAGFGLGMYAWTIQTFLKLREAGVTCQLTDRLPDEGIVLFHANTARGTQIYPGPKRLLVCLKAESPLCPQAQIHVVQNPCEASPSCHFIPHWPQPGLQPRLPERQERFENVAFLGHRDSLAPELLSSDWQAQLERQNLCWLPVINTNTWNSAQSVDTRWNNYQQIDVIVAIRRFRLRHPGYRSKPATKLYNAWLAGVPAILGRELAYRTEGRPGANYLEANSMEELWSCLNQLRQTDLRARLVKRGLLQAMKYTPAAITQRWRLFLQEVALPAYETWCSHSEWQRQIRQWQGQMLSYRDRTQRRLTRLIDPT